LASAISPSLIVTQLFVHSAGRLLNKQIKASRTTFFVFMTDS
jgi:hypothetical protein